MKKRLTVVIFMVLVFATSGLAQEPNMSVVSRRVTTPFTEQVQTSLKGVVHIMCPKWQGSGFVVGPRLIVTARHVVEGVEDFDITTWDGHHIHATKAISDKKHDVAFIWVDDLTCTLEKGQEIECQKVQHEIKLRPLETGSIKECVLGQNVYVIGSPYGKINFNALTVGIISGVDRDWSDAAGDDYGWNVAFTVDSAGHPGNSGCPVFTTDGVVRGILVGGFSPVLISVMPCDLFLEDLGMIQLMFAMGKYRFEEAPDSIALDVYTGYSWVCPKCEHKYTTDMLPTGECSCSECGHRVVFDPVKAEKPGKVEESTDSQED